MTSKWNMVQRSFERGHRDFEFPTATFYNYSETYNNATDDWNTTTTTVGTTSVELVPPSADSTVEDDGTSVEFSTSIRLPSSDSILDSLVFYGVDGEKASQVEILGTRYICQSKRPEHGSGFSLIRLVEA